MRAKPYSVKYVASCCPKEGQGCSCRRPVVEYPCDTQREARETQIRVGGNIFYLGSELTVDLSEVY